MRTRPLSCRWWRMRRPRMESDTPKEFALVTLVCECWRTDCGGATIATDSGGGRKGDPVTSSSTDSLTSVVPGGGAELREGYAEVGDARLHYVEVGDGPLVVLLHGFPEFWYGW